MDGVILYFVGAIILIMIAMSIKKSSIPQSERPKDIVAKTTVIQCANIPQGTESIITTTDSEVVISSNGFEKKIPHQDIIKVTTGLANQITGTNQFSVGKAVLGTAILGGVGAFAGFSGNHNYTPKTMIISYKEDDEINYMTFLQKTFDKATVSQLEYQAKLLENTCIQMNNRLAKEVIN